MTSDLTSQELQTNTLATDSPSKAKAKAMSATPTIPNTEQTVSKDKGKGKAVEPLPVNRVSEPELDQSVAALISEGKQALALNETEKAVDLFGNASSIL
jgi:hypothetical protein